MMSQKKFLQVNSETGEVEGSFVAYVAKKHKNGFQQEGWVAMGQHPLRALAKANLGEEAMRVFMILSGHLEQENFILTPQSQMAAEIEMDRGHFSRAVKKLVDEGVILRGPKIGRMVSLKLNPEYGWKGSAKNHVVAIDTARKERQKQRMESAGITGVVPKKD
jgi:DNA-binding transcriptional regulator YhcF (GntR family)